MRAGVSPGLEGGHEASPTTLTVTLQKELCMGVPSEPIGGQAWGSNRQDTPLPAASPRPSLYTSEDLWDLNQHVGRPGRKPRPRGNENHTPHGHVVCVRDGGRGRLAVVDRQTARAGHRLRSPTSDLFLNSPPMCRETRRPRRLPVWAAITRPDERVAHTSGKTWPPQTPLCSEAL